jgi:hypothetical protein
MDFQPIIVARDHGTRCSSSSAAQQRPIFVTKHRAAQRPLAAAWTAISSPLRSILLVYRKPLRFVTNLLKPRNEGVIRLNGSLYRCIVRVGEANRLQ